MSIPKKGTRKIIVDGEPFIWLIRRQATNSQADDPEGHLHVAVEHATESGSVLVVITDRFHPQGYSLINSELVPIQPQDGSGEIRAWSIERRYEITAVTPKDVALWIKQAMQIGWLPRKSGITFEVNVIGSSIKKSICN
ncbi:hypothetical protein CDG77_28590 [Nostoc sp. 'Peltigera membranacea cyanobiont' 213]|uniref:hypothetical protein n=1 Tax=unclassified Nostoc TaxID=2593658 RepID=UPI000B95C308|nr:MULTISPECIES: hypothetical protein [unclassified Nostoc]AVH66082.1 hypothetical protein NPM_4555 [Nostoc sp. 'Peltigera membranacea cyanobiont' N6]OYD87565.1 hypothetical protein CDG77_28590 [Nostoc sp. 'Peltigera membranacea cyanobiont' 213]